MNKKEKPESKIPLISMIKALRILFGRLSLVDKRFELSKLDLLKDFAKVIDFCKMNKPILPSISWNLINENWFDTIIIPEQQEQFFLKLFHFPKFDLLQMLQVMAFVY